MTLSGLAINWDFVSPRLFEVELVLGQTTEVNFTIACVEPSRRRLAFTSSEPGRAQHEIYLINADGTGRSRLTSHGASWPRWSPDGTRIAYVTLSGGLGLMKADGTGHGTLTEDLGNFYPCGRPDRTRIAYIDDLDRIGVINADGTGQMTLTDGPVEGVPSWSADGARLVFARTDKGHGEIYVVNADGTGTLQLTNNDDPDPGHPDDVDLDPAWSPDGSRIAFISGRGPDESAEHIFTMSPSGDEVRQITTGNVRYFRRPVWSPDGTRLVHHFGERPGGGGRFQGLGSVNVADGSSGGFGGFDRASPAWSPDGSLIAYVLNFDVWVSRPHHEGALKLTETHGGYGPDWEP